MNGRVIFLFYRKLWLVLIVLMFLLNSCRPFVSKPQGNAEEILQEIVSQFYLPDGVIYSKREDAEYLLTDSLLERMFPDTGDLADFYYVSSAAVWFSRRFSEGEIVVLELCDLSHQRELLRLLSKRTEKKENAVAFANGIYVYLICTDKNKEIMRYLQ